MSRSWEEMQVIEETDTGPRISRRTILTAGLRTTQLALGFTVLFLTGYATSVFHGDFFHTFALAFVSFLWTLLLFILLFILPRWLPKWNVYWCRLTVEIITCIFWLSTFSLLVWECMNGDATFAIFRESGLSDIVAYATASKFKAAIVGLKVATGLSCINWMVFAVTFFFATRQSSE